MKMKFIFLAISLFICFSCNKDNGNNDLIKQEDGEVWISGGLATCAEQIHLDKGDTLIVSLEEISTFKTGDKVNVKYKEQGSNKICTYVIDCEIMDVKKIN